MAAPNFNSLLQPDEAASRLYGNLHEVDTVEVTVDTLDHRLADVPSISFLKIDVQGLENAVLSGATDVLRRTAAVQLEASFVSHYRGDSLFCDLAASMAARGFSLWQLAPPFQHHSGRTLWADAIFLRTDLLPKEATRSHAGG